MTTTQQHSQMPEPEPCQRCGKLTIYALCDACQTAVFRDGLQLAQASTMMPLPPSVSATLAQIGQRAPGRQPLSPQKATRSQRTLADVTWLADIGEIGGPLDGDEFRATLTAVEWLPEATPPAPREWSGLCLTCLREQRERGVEAVTPSLSRIQPCRRHLRGWRLLARWLRNEETFRVFCEAFGFGPDGERRDGGRKGGAA